MAAPWRICDTLNAPVQFRPRIEYTSLVAGLLCVTAARPILISRIGSSLVLTRRPLITREVRMRLTTVSSLLLAWWPVFLLAASPASTFKNNVVPSWGDYVVAFGPGTDPALDSPEAVQNMIRHWKERGYTGLYLRTDLGQLAPEMVHRNNVVQPNPRLALLWHEIDRVMASFDAHVVAQKTAEPLGFEFWSWHPHLYSDGAPENVGTPAPDRMVPWSYVSAYTASHPEVISVDRNANRLWMVSEYAYPGARAAKVAEFVHMAKNLGIKRFVACMRSELSQIQDPPDKADRYGFNQPIVQQMHERYGVDIMTDPRFDVDRPDFDPHDPMVEHWHELRGQHVTQLYRELRQALRQVDPKIRLAVTLSGEHVGPPLGNWRLDWRTWVDEGLVDEIITPVTFEATLDHQAQRKGYLTDVRAGVGLISFADLHAYIAKSPHPEIQIIASGAYPYFFSPPPSGADGWRSDVWYDSYPLAWYQRWQQWKTDLKQRGFIEFLRQDFDALELPDNGRLEAAGCPAHVPNLRSCPGCWYRLGHGNDPRPTLQTAIRRGLTGKAVKLTRSTSVDGSLTGWHNCAPDRSTPTACVDNAMTNGRCTLEFWILRPDQSSSLSAYLLGAEEDVALQCSPETGIVRYRSGKRWITTNRRLETGLWQPLRIKMDLDAGTYSAFLGEDETTLICRDVKYTMPSDRFVSQPGVNLPIRVPAYKVFDSVRFVPEGNDGSITYLDDVSIRWIPTLNYAPPEGDVVFSCDFETYRVDSEPGQAIASQDSQWKIPSDALPYVSVIRSNSFGQGVKSLLIRGGTEITANVPGGIPLDTRSTITIDCDLFLRSSSPFPSMIPDPAATSRHHVTLNLRDNQSGAILASIHAGNGTWRFWTRDHDTDSGVPIAYDVWNHVQIALDTSNGTYRLVIQPLGQLPVVAGDGRSSAQTHPAARAVFSMTTSATDGHMSCYDNVLITRARR